ncbi:hypothetical protein HK100_007041 [Physocladia obscura]|uniref:N-acetyltransferase domain-containing protein n=1 Tax=Physocladia obscura TaxID=109957 RepID=A0AAD5SQT1_9FUNG|nr:hypothetical protein HK100_007041 [Physocladia obscura]
MTQDPRFFTHDWRMTIPGPGTIKFVLSPITPASLSSFVTIYNEPATPEEHARLVASSIKRRVEVKTTGKLLVAMLYMATDVHRMEPLGHGAIARVTPDGTVPSVGNIGIKLLPAARGCGAGTAFLRALLRLSCDVVVDQVEIATMHHNTAMRAVAKKVGLNETLEVKYSSGGEGEIIADVIYFNIDREAYRNVEMELLFGDEIIWD